MAIKKKNSKLSKLLKEKMKLNEVPVNDDEFSLLTEAEVKKKSKDFDKVVRRSTRRSKKLQPGTMVTFRYIAKYAKILPKYDSNPTVLVIHHATAKSTGNKLIYGVNMNWLNPAAKRKVMDLFVNEYMIKKEVTLKSERKIMKRFIHVLYKTIKSDPELQVIIKRNAFRAYIIPRIKTLRLIPMKQYDLLFSKKYSQIYRARWIVNKELISKKKSKK